MDSFTAFIELISAFNFGFVVSNKLSNLFFEKIIKVIKKINRKKDNIKSKIILAKDNFFNTAIFHIYTLFDMFASKFINLDNFENYIEKIEKKLTRIFLLSGLYGVVLLFYAGQQQFHNHFAAIEILILNICFWLLILKNYIYL